MIDAHAESVEPFEAPSPFVRGELPSTNQDDEGVGHFQGPDRRQFECGSFSDSAQHRGGLFRSPRGVES
jgi:hypothetical protein